MTGVSRGNESGNEIPECSSSSADETIEKANVMASKDTRKEAQPSELWPLVDHIHEWLNAHPAQFGHEAQWRIGKISEELGEVQTALVSVAGQNPRKANRKQSTWSDVSMELCDVMIAAAVALRWVHDAERIAVADAPAAFSARLATIADRVGLRASTVSQSEISHSP